MKKGGLFFGVKKSGLFFAILLFGIVFTLSFVLADHIVKNSASNALGTVVYVNEEVGFIYNISVNNTGGATSNNITEVNVTLPSGLSFLAFSNSTDSGTVNKSFINTSSVLSWSNVTDGLVFIAPQYFQFNATMRVPGTYKLNIHTSNLTGTNVTNISVVVNDTTAPNVTLISPVNNTSGRADAFNFTFNVSDEGSVVNCSLVFGAGVVNYMAGVNNTEDLTGMYNSSLAVNNYTWYISCVDENRNTGSSSTRNLVVTAAPATTSDSSFGGAGVVEQSYWAKTYSESGSELAEKGEVVKALAEKERVSVKVEGSNHHIGVVKLTSSTRVTVNVSSKPQEKEILINETAKFEVTEDNFYDVSIRLNDINLGKANLTITYIHEEIPAVVVPPVAQNNELEITNDEILEEEEGSTTWMWILIGAIVLVIAGVIGFLYVKNRGQ